MPASRQGPPAPQSIGADLPGLLLAGAPQLLGLLAATFLDRLLDVRGGLLGRLGRSLRCILSDLLAALDGLLAGLDCAMLDLVSHRPDALVLDPRGWDRHADQEPDGDSAEGQAERILFRNADRLLRPF